MVIGVDQSYTRTGISIAVDGKLRKVSSIDFRGARVKPVKRKMLGDMLSYIIKKNQHKATEALIICERIRTFSAGKDAKKKSFISMDYIKGTGALISVIVDTAYEFGISVYSVDTRSWKAQVLGSSKSKKEDKKLESIKFVKKLGFDLEYKSPRGLQKFDDDAADSACMALYGFIPKEKQKLKLEE